MKLKWNPACHTKRLQLLPIANSSSTSGPILAWPKGRRLVLTKGEWIPVRNFRYRCRVKILLNKLNLILTPVDQSQHKSIKDKDQLLWRVGMSQQQANKAEKNNWTTYAFTGWWTYSRSILLKDNKIGISSISAMVSYSNCYGYAGLYPISTSSSLSKTTSKAN